MRAAFLPLVPTLSLCVAILAGGCDIASGPADQDPLHPIDPTPQVPGILEVSITTNGSKPDADGYAVAVSVEEVDSPLQAIGPMGGTVRFGDMPLGSHSVRLESLAPNCSVQGRNPREFTITAAGQTVQVGFAVSCPGPGAVFVKAVTTGDDQDDEYVVVFQAGSTQKAVPIGANDSLRIGEEDLPAETSWASIEGLADNCRAVGGSYRTVAIRGDATTRVDFSIECMAWTVYSSGIVYDRVSPHSGVMLSVHGTVSERYILLPNSRFRLQLVSGRFGTYEYLGAYRDSGSTISFVFDSSGWYATGTLTGNTLSVRYNDWASMDGFEDGDFVRLP